MKVSMNLVGDKKLESTLIRQKIRVKREAKKICLNEAQTIMSESLKEVPRDTNALANSAFVTQLPNGDVNFGYGHNNVRINPKTGKSTDEYMVEVHEDLGKYHAVGKAKFLEDPVLRHRGPLFDSFVKKLRRSFGF